MWLSLVSFSSGGGIGLQGHEQHAEVSERAEAGTGSPALLSCSRRFKKKGHKWFGWSDKEAQAQWDAALRDPATPRARDGMGNITLASDKFQEKLLATGARTGTVREVVERAQHAVEDIQDQSAMQRIRNGPALKVSTTLSLCPETC